jgi:hypothetical protein
VLKSRCICPAKARRAAIHRWQTGITNTLGNYSLPAVANGTYDLEVTPAFGSAYGLLRKSGVEVTGAGDAQDLSLYNISGTISNADTGAGIGGVTLRVCHIDGCETSILASLLTDGNGNYVLANPPHDTWLFSVIFDGYVDYLWGVVADGNDKTHDIALAPFKGITGKVYAGGVPLANATVNLTLAGSETLEASVTTDATGLYRLWNPPGGVHDLVVLPPSGSSYKAATVASVQYIENTRMDRDITLSASGFAISGRVTGESAGDDDGVAGAAVKVLSGTTVVGTAVTNASGNYQVSGVNGAAYDIIITPPSGSAYAVNAIHGVVAGSAGRGNVQLDVFMLEGATVLTGTVTDLKTGAAIAGATVEICLETDCDNGAFPPVIGTATTNASGVYTIDRMPLGTSGLRVTHTGHRKIAEVITLNAALVQRDIVLTPVYSLNGVISGGGSPVTGATVELYAAGTVQMQHTTLTNTSGQYLLPDLVTGVYDLVITPVEGSAFFPHGDSGCGDLQFFHHAQRAVGGCGRLGSALQCARQYFGRVCAGECAGRHGKTLCAGPERQFRGPAIGRNGFR